MGQDLFARPEGREVLAEASRLGWDRFVPEISAKEFLQTSVAQPAIFLVEWAGFLVANINAPDQVVLPGEPSALSRAEKLAKETGGKALRLVVAGAFHSPFMAKAAQEFAQILEDLVFRPPTVTFVSSSTGEVENDLARIKEILKGQMTAAVQWVKAVETVAALRVDEAWKIGPGQVLTRLGRRITARICFRALEEVAGNV